MDNLAENWKVAIWHGYRDPMCAPNGWIRPGALVLVKPDGPDYFVFDGWAERYNMTWSHHIWVRIREELIEILGDL